MVVSLQKWMATSRTVMGELVDSPRFLQRVVMMALAGGMLGIVAANSAVGARSSGISPGARALALDGSRGNPAR